MVEMKKRTLLIALAVIALGLIGTGLSALYEQNEFIVTNFPMGTTKFSYGFPLGWQGYSIVEVGFPVPDGIIPEIHWFSLESFLLDAAFWVAISSVGCIAIVKSMNMLHKARTSKKLSVKQIQRAILVEVRHED